MRAHSLAERTNTHGKLPTRPLEGKFALLRPQPNARDRHYPASVGARKNHCTQHTHVRHIYYQQARAVAQSVNRVQISQQHDRHQGLELELVKGQRGPIEGVEHFLAYA